MKLIKILFVIFIIINIANAQSDEKVDINFRNLAIGDFVQMISKITEKNILIDTEISGKINFVSSKPVRKSDLIPLANSILLNKGLTLIDQGNYLKVVKMNQAAGEGVGVGSRKSSNGMMNTVLFRLKNSNAEDISMKIKPLLHQDAQVIAFKDNNVLSVTALPQSLKSVQKYINELEISTVKKPTFIKLKNTRVGDVFNNIVQISKDMFPENIPSQTVEVLKDENENRLILIGNSTNKNALIPYIKQFDIRGEGSSKQMYVIPLENSDVVEMEKILNPLLSQMNSMDSVSAPSSNISPVASDMKKTMVVADIERNSLVVLATPEQISNIRSTVYAIDRPRAQVYVKARIVEINNNVAKQLGLRYGFEGGKITSRALFSAAANMGASSLMVSNNLLSFLNSDSTSYDANGNVITTTNKPFSFNSDISEIFSIGARIDLLQEHGAAHILSEPSVLCTNNKEASIYVGQTQSILTQAQQSTTGQANIINNYSREDIGITLKIKPRLSNQNKVALDVETQIEDILPSSGSSADRPTTTKRKVVTNAVVNNGETIVLGGLIKNSGGKTITKVPILGDIPILGELFKSRGTADSNVNVIVYLTPYVVKSSNDMKRLKSALSELEDVQTRYNNYVLKGLESNPVKSIAPKEQNTTLSIENHDNNTDGLEIISSSDGNEKALKLK